MAELVLYVKSGCHLCEDAGDLLDRLQPEYGYRVRRVDIASDAGLYERYGELIPVVEHEGRLLLHAPFGEGMARKMLAGALGGGS